MKQQPGQHRENGVDINSPEARLADLFHTLKNIAPVDPNDVDAVSSRAHKANTLYVAIQLVAKDLTNPHDKKITLGKAQVIMEAVLANKAQVSQYLIADLKP
mgnify:CR=1 FL=1